MLPIMKLYERGWGQYVFMIFFVISEQAQRVGSRRSEAGAVAAWWEQAQRGESRRSDVGAGAARWEQAQRGRSRCSEERAGAARWEQAHRVRSVRNRSVRSEV